MEGPPGVQPLKHVGKAQNPQMVKNYTDVGVSVPIARSLVHKDLNLMRKARTIERFKKTNEALTQIALIDPLTGLYTRRFLDGVQDEKHPIPSGLRSEVEVAKRSNTPLAVAMIDADFFKKVNDEHGHQVGDIVLKNIAKLILGNIRVSDKAIRYGGEEILLLLPDTTGEQALIITERIRKAVEEFDYTTLGIPGIHTTVSSGIAAFNEPGKGMITSENLISTADKAVYKAKDEGRNTTFIAEEIVDEEGNPTIKFVSKKQVKQLESDMSLSLKS